MNRPVSLSVIVACLIVVAGCATTVERPPGVEEESLTNREALFDAHEEILLADGFEYRITEDSRTTDRGNYTLVVRVEPEVHEYHVINRHPNGTILREYWGNESVVLVRGYSGNGYQYYRPYEDHEIPPTEFLTGREQFERWLSGILDIPVTNTVERDTHVLTEFVGARESGERSPPVTVRLVAGSDGTVRFVRYNETFRYQSRNVTVVQTFELLEVGDISVKKPDWVRDAKNAS